MLSQAEIDAFVADGFVAVRSAVPPDLLRACQDEIWAAIEAQHDVRLGDPATWREPVVRVSCPETAASAGRPEALGTGQAPGRRPAMDLILDIKYLDIESSWAGTGPEEA